MGTGATPARTKRIASTCSAILVCLTIGIAASVLLGLEARVWVPAAATVGALVGVVASRAAKR